jgi:hypothetical protein
MRLLEDELHPRVIVPEAPIGDELEAHALAVRRVLHLPLAGALETRWDCTQSLPRNVILRPCGLEYAGLSAPPLLCLHYLLGLLAFAVFLAVLAFFFFFGRTGSSFERPPAPTDQLVSGILKNISRRRVLNPPGVK